MSLYSGFVLRLAPGYDNPAGFKSFHLIHESLKPYYAFGAVATTWIDYEDTVLGGDHRLSKIGLPKASWYAPRILRCALDAVLDHINLTDLDALVTVRTWNSRSGVFVNRNAICSYLPKEDQENDFSEMLAVTFEFRDMEALV